MTVYNWNGVGNQTVNWNLGTDVLNMTGVDPFDIQTIRNAGGGTSTIFQTPTGTFTMNGVIFQQLTSADVFVAEDGAFVVGSSGDDDLDGSVVLGNTGNDEIDGNPQNNFLQGNQGNDDIDGHGGFDIIRGGQGDDDIHGFDQGSIVYGDRGADDIDANGGPTNGIGVTIYGGNGSPSDPLDGNDDIHGSNGNDYIQGNGGDDTIHGDDGDDVIRGGKGNDNLFGDSGHDWLRGDLGNDHLFGGSQGSTLDGGAGNDDLHAEIRGDILIGGTGDDMLDGGRGNDVETGGAGRDGFYYELSGSGTGWSEIARKPRLWVIPAANTVEVGGIGIVDSITDLNLVNNTANTDHLYFKGFDYSVRTYDSTDHPGDVWTANNMQDVLDDLNSETSGSHDTAVLIHWTDGTFAGKAFLGVDTDHNGSIDYLVNVTGVTGTLDTSDISDWV